MIKINTQLRTLLNIKESIKVIKYGTILFEMGYSRSQTYYIHIKLHQIVTQVNNGFISETKPGKS